MEFFPLQRPPLAHTHPASASPQSGGTRRASMSVRSQNLKIEDYSVLNPTIWNFWDEHIPGQQRGGSSCSCQGGPFCPLPSHNKVGSGFYIMKCVDIFWLNLVWIYCWFSQTTTPLHSYVMLYPDQLGSPLIKTQPRVEREQVVSGPGSSLSLSCLVEGNPQPALQWYFADAKVGNSFRNFFWGMWGWL